VLSVHCLTGHIHIHHLITSGHFLNANLSSIHLEIYNSEGNIVHSKCEEGVLDQQFCKHWITNQQLEKKGYHQIRSRAKVNIKIEFFVHLNVHV
jgi:hypothetical protein